jgi:hypothetical protein
MLARSGTSAASNKLGLSAIAFLEMQPAQSAAMRVKRKRVLHEACFQPEFGKFLAAECSHKMTSVIGAAHRFNEPGAANRKRR